MFSGLKNGEMLILGALLVYVPEFYLQLPEPFVQVHFKFPVSPVRFIRLMQHMISAILLLDLEETEIVFRGGGEPDGQSLISTINLCLTHEIFTIGQGDGIIISADYHNEKIIL
jgi:hypothetical protein